jgi:hypothetical protein
MPVLRPISTISQIMGSALSFAAARRSLHALFENRTLRRLSYPPGDLERQIGTIVECYSQRFDNRLSIVMPANILFGLDKANLRAKGVDQKASDPPSPPATSKTSGILRQEKLSCECTHRSGVIFCLTKKGSKTQKEFNSFHNNLKLSQSS